MNQRTAHVCLFGASPGTGNQGVNALCWSTLTGLAERGCDQLHVFGYGNGSHSVTVPGGHPEVPYTLHGISAGKRVWRPRHLWRASIAARAGARSNVLLRPIAASDAVLDASGGDSFTDLYGPSRFRTITVPKQLALSLGRPLILLPQTYGPFSTTRTRRIARGLVSNATLAYARDPDSFGRLQSLLGGAFDPARHREGVDLAFGLAPRAPQLEPAVARALGECGGRPLIGLNVSGLIANRASTAAASAGWSR